MTIARAITEAANDGRRTYDHATIVARAVIIGWAIIVIAVVGRRIVIIRSAVAVVIRRDRAPCEY
jgi:hypothetical protein